jgi:hypothetical protein
MLTKTTLEVLLVALSIGQKMEKIIHCKLPLNK